MEARDGEPFACPDENSPETVMLDGPELAYLPVVAAESRDMLGEVIYVGKATLRQLWADGV